MKKIMLSTGLFLALASPVFAGWELPVKIGDPQASVKEKLGEPDDDVDLDPQHILMYKSRGLEIGIDKASQTVEEIECVAERSEPEWKTYTGPILGGIDMQSRFGQVEKALGSDYKKDPMEDGSSFRSYVWYPGSDFWIDISFWEEDFKDEAGKVHPAGSIYNVKLFKLK